MKVHSTYPAGSAQERRLDYRVHYPAGFCPKLSLFGHLRDVFDISSTGMCFSSLHDDLARVGQTINAKVVFMDAPAQLVSGTIVHLSGDEISVLLEQGFGFDVIVRERLAVISLGDIAGRATGNPVVRDI